jgi:hypothetical protein
LSRFQQRPDAQSLSELVLLCAATALVHCGNLVVLDGRSSADTFVTGTLDAAPELTDRDVVRLGRIRFT